MRERIANVAFPASAIVIIGATIAQGLGVEIPEQATAAATGLLTYLAYAFLGAGEKTKDK